MEASGRRALWGALWGAWLLALALNLFKPVHIDDSAHLQIAEHILADPAHPMSGTLMWGDSPEPIHHTNQPHLFFYLLALVHALFGESLLASHGLVALFTGLALVCWQRLLLRWVEPVRVAWLTLALALGPALLPGQNIMTDVPLLALWLLSALGAMAAAGSGSARHWALTGLWVGLACLLKYTSLVGLPLLALGALLSAPQGRRRRLLLAALAAPVGLLTAWSFFNYLDYGGIHLLGRPIEVGESASALEGVGIALGRCLIWIMGLGAVSPQALLLWPSVITGMGRRRFWIGAVAILLVVTAGGRVLAGALPPPFGGESPLHSLLRALVFVNGLVFVAGAWQGYRRARQQTGRGFGAGLFGLWALGTGLFVAVLAPFVAVRHILLSLPPLMLLAFDRHAFGSAGPRLRRGSLALTALLGIWCGVSDHRFAAVYRDQPARLRAQVGEQQRVHYVGHWGYQHYAAQAGFAAYVPGVTRLQVGDLLVRPEVVHSQPIRAEDMQRLKQVGSDVIDAGPSDLLRTVSVRQGYYSLWQGLPWMLTDEPLERFQLYRVVD